MSSSSNQRENWGSRLGFILAAAGSAIGLGNIWRFPYLAGESGGAAFLFVYLLAVLFIGLTVMLCEFAVGRAAGLDAIGSFNKIAPKSFWWISGAMGVLAAFLISSFYGVVGGWTLAYFTQTLKGSLSGLSSAQYTDTFVGFISNPVQPVIWQVLFMIVTIGIVVLGVQGGIEKWSKILLPAIFVILLLLIVRGITLEGAMQGIDFYLKPDFSKIDGGVVLAALSQAFFSLSLGMGILITFGSYINKQENIVSAALTVCGLDTLVAFLAGLAIFPAVFATGMSPDVGPGLVFVVLPAVFDKMPLGNLFGAGFFVLLAFAALTSSISLLECVVAFLKDQLGLSRKTAAIGIGSVITILGVFCSLSMGALSGFTIPFPAHGAVNLFDFLDYFTSKLLLPLSSLIICLFVAFQWKFRNANLEVTNNGALKVSWLPIWNFLVMFVAPIVIILVLLNGFKIIG